MRIMTISVIAWLLAGCASGPAYNADQDFKDNKAKWEEKQPGKEVKLDNSEYYSLGNGAGYQSGKNATGSFNQFQKDIELYVNNPYYKSGWDDGFQKGKAEGENMNAIIRDSVR